MGVFEYITAPLDASRQDLLSLSNVVKAKILKEYSRENEPLNIVAIDKWLELICYLEKHQSEIINYNRRSRAGQTIGSGRQELGVDLTVGQRQKNKGMSWRLLGSKALCLLKVAELNGQWQQLWFPAPSA